MICRKGIVIAAKMLNDRFKSHNHLVSEFSQTTTAFNGHKCNKIDVSGVEGMGGGKIENEKND